MLTTTYEITERLEDVRQQCLPSEFRKTVVTYSQEVDNTSLRDQLRNILENIHECDDSRIKNECKDILEGYVEAEDDYLVFYL